MVSSTFTKRPADVIRMLHAVYTLLAAKHCVMVTAKDA